MTRFWAIGVTTHAAAEPLRRAAPRLSVIGVGPVALVCVAHKAAPYHALRLRRRPAHLGEDVRTRAVAAAAAYGPFLAVDPAPRPANLEALTRLVAPYGSALMDALNAYGSFVRYDLTAHWDVDAVVGEIESAGLLPRALRLPEGPLRAAHRHDVTTALDAALDARRGRISARLARLCAEAGVAYTPLKARTPSAAAAARLTFVRSATGRLGDIAAELERADGLVVRTEGPRPCPDVACLTLFHTSARRVAAAAKTLDVAEPLTRADLKSAYYAALKTHHPDLRGGGRPDGALVARLHEAYETLLAVADQQGALSPADPVRVSARAIERRALRLKIGADAQRLAAAARNLQAAPGAAPAAA